MLSFYPALYIFYVSPKLKSKQEDWHQFRGNRFLTGRSLLKGNILYPQIKWKNFIGARETLVNIQLSNNLADELVLPNTNTGSLDDTLKRWKFGFPLLDFDDSGDLTSVSLNGTFKVGKFPPNYAGLQKVEFDTSFEHPDPEYPLRGRIFVRHENQWKMSAYSQ